MNKNENQNQNKLQEVSAFYDPDFPEGRLNAPGCEKYSLKDLAALGVGCQPLMAAIQKITGKGAGKSGLYYVDTKGKTMMQFKDGARDYLGNLAQDNGQVGGGIAHLKPVAFDPQMVSMAAMAVALENIEEKLDDIEELQQEMMDFLTEQERAKIQGNINTLNDVLINYKFNWDNEQYKNNKHILVQDIRREAQQEIQLYRQQIEDIIEERNAGNRDSEVRTKIEKAVGLFRDYQMALYQYGFSTFLEVLLLENFDSQYLDSATDSIEQQMLGYRELYTDCYNWLEKSSRFTLQAVLEGGAANIGKGAGKAIAKIPLINKGPVDEALIAAGEKVEKRPEEKTQEAMQLMQSVSGNCNTYFTQYIQKLKSLYNEPVIIMFDQNNLYIEKKEEIA